MNKQYLYNDNSDNVLLNQLATSHINVNKPKNIIVKNGIILPRKENNKNWGWGVIADKETIILPEIKAFGGYYDFNEEDVEDYDFEVVYLGYLIPHYGVFLVDFFRRMSAPLTEYCNTKIAFCGINFPEKCVENINPNCKELFDLLDITEDRFIDVRKPSRFKKVIIPDVGYEYDSYYYPLFIEPYKLIRQEIGKTIGCSIKNQTKDKGYLSRTKFSQNKESGEKIFEKFFKENGWSIIYPEEYSIAEQVYIYSHVKSIASIEGTIAHNILFSNPGTQQIIIRKQQYLNPRQIIFNEITKTDAQYIDCYKEPFYSFPVDHDSGPFLILFNKNMKCFAKDNDMKYHSIEVFFYNIRSILRYLLLCLQTLYPLGCHKIWKFIHRNDVM